MNEPNDFVITHPVTTDRLGVEQGGTPVAIRAIGTPPMTTTRDDRRRCPVCDDILILSGWCAVCARYRPLANQATRKSR